jgi:DNA modification methylase
MDRRTRMTPLLDNGQRWRIVHGDTLTLLPDMPDASVDAVVCDPPYGIDFKHQPWDGQKIRADHPRLSSGQAYERWTEAWATEIGRVLKPGGHLVAFGAARMVHRLASGLEDAGLEVRDQLLWMFGPGFPKSQRTDDGKATTLKPFYEPIVLARRSPSGSVAKSRSIYGTGLLNIDDCSPAEDGARRWPAPILFSHSPDCGEDGCTPDCAAAAIELQRPGASRFLYCAKATRAERNAGCEHLPAVDIQHFPVKGHPPSKPLHNTHPTVKPIALMRWLVRLVTPDDGVVLDLFCGSGSTGVGAVLEGRRFLGLERESDYVEVAHARIAHWEQHGDA